MSRGYAGGVIKGGPAMNAKKCCAVLSLVSFVSIAAVVAAETAPAKPAPASGAGAPAADGGSSLPPGELTVGVLFGDQQAEVFGDVLVPLYSFDSGLLFLNPRGSLNDDDAQEFNLGVGSRWLLPGREMIVGANIFYDHRYTDLDNEFNQAGAGLEFFSKWVDARANYYKPESGRKASDHYVNTSMTVQENYEKWKKPVAEENAIVQSGVAVSEEWEVTTRQHFRRYEEAMEGFDAELGLLLPIPVVKDFADVRAFLGYAHYDNPVGEDPEGLKARLECHALPSLYLDAEWYEDEDLYQTTYSVGGRVRLPLDMAGLARGRNPFKGAMDGFVPAGGKPPFASRMTEMVIRDLHVRTGATEPEEIVQDRAVVGKQVLSRKKKPLRDTLEADVTFVDDDNRTGTENGSWEYPYRTVTGGVAHAIGSMVYVRDASNPYLENVTLVDDLVLWGSGARIYGHGGRYFGNDIYPVLNGQGLGPAITLADRTTVAGMEITQPMVGPSGDGIYGHNVTDVRILGNYIHGSALTVHGVDLVSDAASGLRATIAGNRMEDLLGSGIHIDAAGVGLVELEIMDNQITGCDMNGVAIIASGSSGLFSAMLSGDYSGNTGAGILLQAVNYDEAYVMAAGVAANGNGSDGIRIILDNVDDAYVTMMGVAASGNTGTGLAVDMLGDGDKLLSLGGIVANGNWGQGLRAHLLSSNGVAMVMAGMDPAVQGLVRDGADLMGASLPWWWDMLATGPVQADGNAAGGIQLTVQGDDLALAALFDVHACGNTGMGINAVLDSADGVAGALIASSRSLTDLAQFAGDLLGTFLPLPPLEIPGAAEYGPVMVSGNMGGGINVVAVGHEAALVGIMDAVAEGNGGFGLNSVAVATNGFAATLVAGMEANGNAAGGINLVGQGEDAAIALLIETDASFNGGFGVNSVQASEGVSGTALSSLDALKGAGETLLALLGEDFDLAIPSLGYLQIEGNGAGGVNLVADGRDLAFNVVMGAVADGNGGWGVNTVAVATNGVALSVLAAIQANGNSAGGINLVGQGDGAAIAAILDAKANNNGGFGINSVQVSDGFSGTILTSFRGLEKVGDLLGGLTGGDVDLGVLPDLGPLEASGNAAGGINLVTQGRSIAINAVLDAVADGNGGFGLNGVASATNGIVINLAAGIEANGNSAGGINLVGQGEEAAIGALLGVEANDNGGQGINSVHVSEGLAANVVGSFDGLEILAGLLGGLMGGGLELGGLPDTGPVEAIGNAGGGIHLVSQAPEVALNAAFDVVAVGNGASGFDSVAVATNGVAITVLAGVQADHNAAGGIGVVGVGYDAAVTVMLDVFANHNMGMGIQSTASSDDGVAGTVIASSRSLVAGAGVATDALGVDLELPEIPTDGPVEANHNGGGGIMMTSVGRQASFGALLDAEIEGNTGLGLMNTVVSENGPAISALAFVSVNENLGMGAMITADSKATAVGVVLESEFNRNQASGLMMTLVSSDDDVVGALGAVEASGNDGPGILFTVDAFNDAYGAFTDVRAIGNNGQGILATLAAGDGDVHAWFGPDALALLLDETVGAIPPELEDLAESLLPSGVVRADGNADTGILLHAASTGGSAYVDMAWVSGSLNGNNGLDVRATGTGGEAMVTMDPIRVNGNAAIGVYGEATAGGPGSPASVIIRGEGHDNGVTDGGATAISGSGTANAVLELE